jgi:hypothetical protein
MSRRRRDSLDDHNPDHVNPRGDYYGDVYDDCDNIVQVFVDVNIAVFWVVISYSLVGVQQRFGERASTVGLNLKMEWPYSFETSVSTCRTVRRYRTEDENLSLIC